MPLSNHVRPSAALRLRRYLAVVLSVLFMVAASAGVSATAQTLDQSKAAGQIGEQPDGYVGIVDSSAPPAVRQMVDEVNLKRRERYRGIASKNGTNLQAVEALTGKKLIEDAPSGQYVRLPDGRWVRK